MLRILDHAWHQPHSYRLHALPATFDYYLVGSRTWDERVRPVPPNWRGFVCDPDPAEYDLILSHIDNWVDRSPLRATPFRVMNLIAKGAPGVPRVCIMHGTPDNEENRQNITRILDDAPGGAPFMVCNSQQAYEDWGLGPERSRAIIHGYDVDEFWSSNRRTICAITVCSAGEISRSYHGVPLLERIRRDVPVVWCGENGDIPPFPSYEQYREWLATSLIYVHTGQRSPMPGGRTEAMLSGCCVVSTSNNDADTYIEHGETGFLCDTAVEMIETLKMLLAEPEQAYRVGKRGREAARVLFAADCFIADWMRLLDDLGVHSSHTAEGRQHGALQPKTKPNHTGDDDRPTWGAPAGPYEPGRGAV